MERGTQPPPVAEKPNQEAEQLPNLDHVKIQAQSLQKAISRLLEDIHAYTQTNTTLKWKDILGRFKMINLDLFILVEEVKQVSEDIVVYPKNVNAENAAILPVMLATKLLPEMETDNKVKCEQLLQDVQSLPIPTQIETLKERIGRIAEACENAAKVLTDARKAYGLGPRGRGGPPTPPTDMDKAQAAKILEQENMLRAAVNDGEGIRLPPDQREITTSALPPHMMDALFVSGAVSNSSGMMQTQQSQSESQSQSQQPEQQQQQQP